MGNSLKTKSWTSQTYGLTRNRRKNSRLGPWEERLGVSFCKLDRVRVTVVSPTMFLFLVLPCPALPCLALRQACESSSFFSFSCSALCCLVCALVSCSLGLMPHLSFSLSTGFDLQLRGEQERENGRVRAKGIAGKNLRGTSSS